jgi:hypothetical protein
MAVPNAVNPKFIGQVQAESFEATHGDGVCTTVLPCNGATAVYFFDSANATGCSLRGTITGAWLCTIGSTGRTVTLKGAQGATICTFTEGSSIGTVVGPNAALANTAIDLTTSISIVSTSWPVYTSTSLVFVTYKTDEA